MADLEVRATIRLLDLQPGEVVHVDPSDPYIAKLLSAGWLVPTRPSAEQESTSTDDGE
jgi:hypothetical protein